MERANKVIKKLSRLKPKDQAKCDAKLLESLRNKMSEEMKKVSACQKTI